MADETPTAILTKGQREYLAGDRTPTQERTMRTRIRERVRIGILDDLPLVMTPRGDDVEPFDPEEIFDPEGGDPVTGRELADSLRSMVALSYQLADAGRLDPEEIIEEGIEQGRRSRSEYLVEWFQKDPKRLTIEEMERVLELELVDPVEWVQVRNEVLGLPEPRGLDAEALDELDEEVDDIPLGIADLEDESGE